MRWQSKDPKEEFEWRTWFAWYPVKTVCGINVWLEYVERRKNEFRPSLMDNYHYETEYRIREKQ
jgi:hypothetical protein